MGQEEPIQQPIDDNSNLVKFGADMQKSAFIPVNEYELAHSVTRSEMEAEEEDKLTFSKIVDSYVQTANIGNDTIMRYYQTDIDLLNKGFSLAQRSRAFAMFFKPRYYGWRSEILITKAFNGELQKHIFEVGKKVMQKEGLLGYGSGYGDLEPEKKEKNIFDRLMGKK